MITKKSSVGRFDMTGDNSVPQGATRTVQLKIYQNGILANFSSGFTAKLQVRQTYGSPVLIELNTSDGSIVLSSGSGNTPNVVLTFLPIKTKSITQFDDLIYDFALYGPNGVIYKYLEGNLSITPTVTI